MKTQVLGNYLRTHRKKSGLSQRELGLLLGYKDQGQISRHERFKTVPPLLTALAYQAVFRAPVSELFAGIHNAVAQAVEGNVVELQGNLQRRSDKGHAAKATSHKLEWLTKRKSP